MIASSSVSRRPVLVADRLRRDFDAGAPRCSSSSRMTSARAACCQAAIGLRRRVMLHLAHDRVARNGTPLTLTVTGFPAGNWRVDRAGHRGYSAGTARVRGGRRRCFAAHHLIAAPAEIPDRRAPDVHQTGERKHQEDRHAEEQMQLEDRVHVGNRASATPGCSVRMPCAQVMNFTISWPSRWLSETQMVGSPRMSCAYSSSRIAISPNDEVVADARVEQPAMHQQRDADEAERRRRRRRRRSPSTA